MHRIYFPVCQKGVKQVLAHTSSARHCPVCVLPPGWRVTWRAHRAATTLTATYNDLEGVRKLFQENKGEIAGVILEPVVGNSGFIPPTQEFLQARSLGLRSLLCAVSHCSCVLPVDVSVDVVCLQPSSLLLIPRVVPHGT